MYTIIESEIHDHLSWDHDEIVKCLSAIITNCPWHTEENIKFEIEVIPVCSAHNNGLPYPSLGLKNIVDPNFNPDILEQRINNWVSEIGINQLVDLGKNYQGKSWKEISTD